MSLSSSIDLCTRTLWWPTEVVSLQVEVVMPRKLTALEWALLRVMDVFRDAPPELPEVALELGLDDPQFLTETRDDLVRLRALAPREGDTWQRFGDLTFTETGETLYRRGQIEGEPARHGIDFYVDAATDEDLPKPKEINGFPARRFLEGEVEPRETLGLDRVRAVMRQHHPDVMKGDAEVRSVEARYGSRLAWRPVPVRLGVSAAGDLVAEPAGSAAMQSFLASRDLEAAGLALTGAVSEAWSGPAYRASGWVYSTWRRQVQTVVAADRAAAEAATLVADARSEVVVQGAWAAAPDLEAALAGAIERGVRVLVVGGSEPGVFAWETGGGLGWRSGEGAAVSGALIADDQGLHLDTIQVRWQGEPVPAEVVGRLQPAAVKSHREALVKAALAADEPIVTSRARMALDTPLASIDARTTQVLADDRMRRALARLAFVPGATEAERVVAVACTLASGLERVPLLKSLATRTRHAVVEEGWTAAWRAVAGAGERLGEAQPGLVERLAAWAPTAISLHEYMDFAVAAWAAQANDPAETTQRLQAIARAADARWPGGQARANPAWRQAAAAVVAGDHDLDVLVRLVPQLVPGRDAQAWAITRLDGLPWPPSIAGVAAWARSAEPLRALAGPAVEARGLEIARAWVSSALPADVIPWPVPWVAPLTVARLLVEAKPTLTRLVEVRAAILEEYPKVAEASEWEGLVALVLQDSLIRDLSSLVRALEFPAGRRALLAWARKQAVALPAPTTLDQVLPWLDSVAALAAVPGFDARAPAQDGLRPLAAALREAREASAPTWTSIAATASRLGVSFGWIDPTPPSKGKKKGKKK